MTFENILTAIGSYAFPIIVTVYLLYERANYIKEQSKIMSELKESISVLNENIKDIKSEISKERRKQST